MIRRKFNSTAHQQTSRFDDCRQILRFHSHLGFWSARLPENHRFPSRTAMPIHDPKLPLRIELRYDGSRQAQLVWNAVESIGEENVVDRFGHDLIERHGIGHDEFTTRDARGSSPYSRPVQHDRVDVDGIDATRGSGERGREQSVAATEVNDDHARPQNHFGENFRGIRPQHLPPVGIGHRGCRKKAVRHAAAARMDEFFL